MIKLYLDSGHGGKDSGAKGNGLLEKNLTLEICEKIEAKLKKDYIGIEVLMTRNTDTYVSLSERTNRANKWGADIFLSVHINSSSNASANGFDTHIYPNSDPKTKAFQNVMHKEIYSRLKNYGFKDRGVRSNDFHVLRESHATALLSENGFISSKADSDRLKRVEVINAIVDGHVIGLEKFIGLKKSQQPPRTDDIMYRVTVGTFAEKENAEKLALKLRSQGYNPYITKA
jgi:N-acetylmuramoyl-L-alanine amidase